MELNIRDWMLVIGVLLLLAVALDAYRRAMRERRKQVRLSRNAKRSQRYKAPLQEEFPSELPNGPARVVASGAISSVLDDSSSKDVSSDAPSGKIVWKAKPIKVKSVNEPVKEPLKESVPEFVAEPLTSKDEAVIFDQPLSAIENLVTDNRVTESSTIDEDAKSFAEADTVEVDAIKDHTETCDVDVATEIKEAIIVEESAAIAPANAETQPVENVEKQSEITETEEVAAIGEQSDNLFSESVKKPEADYEQHALFEEQEEIIVLRVLAKNTVGFSGEELLHILLACDCRFGAMDIFHRYESKNAQGHIQFSVVNIVEPGVFKMSDIKNFTTPGVCFFIRLPGPKDPVEAFKCMLETARCLVRHLDGELRDENNVVVTQKIIDALRKRIRDFKKRKR